MKSPKDSRRNNVFPCKLCGEIMLIIFHVTTVKQRAVEGLMIYSNYIENINA